MLRWSALLPIVILCACEPARTPFLPSGDDDAGIPVKDGGRDTPDASVTCGDLLNDSANCGRCGRDCLNGDICIDGECRPTSSCLATGCPAQRAYCDVTTGFCRTGCAQDSDCGDGRLCEIQTHACIHAPTCPDEACPHGHVCDTNGHVCKPGCASESDCPEGFTCGANGCVPPPPTCEDGRCPGGMWCDGHVCQSGCASGYPCPNGAACDLTTHTCRARPEAGSCLSEGCRDGQWCDADAGRCRTGCNSSQECGAGQYCDGVTHQCGALPGACGEGCPAGSRCVAGSCAAGCSTIADCGPGWICADQVCRTAPLDCSVNGCREGTYCDPQTLLCRNGCTEDRVCSNGLTCDLAAARCVPQPANCVLTPRCTVSQKCDTGDGLCKPKCQAAEDCPNGVCDLTAKVCSFECSPENCGPGRYCDAGGRCVEGCALPAYPCPEGQRCNGSTGMCVTIPGDSCPVSCPAGQWCNATTESLCVPGCDRGQPCADDQWCDFATHTCFVPCPGCYDSCVASGHSWCGGDCFDLATTTAHCGGCEEACSSNHIAPVCAGGSCETATCEDGFHDCNQNKRLDGCETPTAEDVNNCGGCNVSCALPNADTGCSVGQCYLAGCRAGWLNCDGNAQNGCEENTSRCYQGTYQSCVGSGVGNCTQGTWCLRSGLGDGSRRMCFRPCSNNGDCPQDQQCLIQVSSTEKACALPCSLGCPNGSMCRNGYCGPPY